mmetsp:Transcript_11068/g.18081  ORF Transcript_11068/g.18081 Transcript_11068/m.18081 type:complete len:355 (-) Transcript_11068:169-1233(-)|eukprot:CAMPEP_0114477584 /NCGR_PEP_ID=MMETSP0104-20121206/15448_1 /TAXON_ID=37642 ORGANISM="Paraphysomonas imperforata, Strain PA2" /NCGR_SAMPLE_ID=MMETSP0104 /ASSEMBLY_ACC=CAM_ASM_000202 /LENGTH=354 /DNA_ID=CAMNT_0001652555 /DNA_START=53 /DNA_END=1117 /DNA_ORIENTATION=+
MSLSFDEFRAVSKRYKKEKGDDDNIATVEDKDDEDDNLSSHDDQTLKNDNISKELTKAPFTVGNFLEMHEIQGLTLLFLLLATFAAFAELSLANNAFNPSTPNVFTLFVNISHSLSTFFVFFFGFEVFSLLVAFRLRIFGHLGYVVDMVVVGVQIWAVSVGVFAVECHILNIFRMWRLIRLFQSMVSVEVEAHHEARVALQSMSVKKKKLEEDVEKITLNLKKEQEARSSVEGMLQDYKDEIDTLNEALKIAALDIAEVAQAEDDFFLSDDDGEGMDDMLSTDMSVSERSDAGHGLGGGGEANSTVSFTSNDTENSALKKKEALYKEAMSVSKTAPSAQRSTFVISENGSVQHK